MIAFAWLDGRAVLSINDATISLTQANATALAHDLTNGNEPACFGYPIPTDARTGDYVIGAVTRVANENTIMELARVAGHGHRTDRDPYEYSGAWSVSLTPADRDALVSLLLRGGAR